MSDGRGPDYWRGGSGEAAHSAGSGEPGKRKFPRDVAEAVFLELWRVLDPSPALGWPDALCGRLTAVGGFRRGKREMKDLELLIIPRFGERQDPGDLFGASKPVNLTLAKIDELFATGVLGKRLKRDGSLSAWGDANRHAVHMASELPIDLFFCPAEAWWNRLVVTTGSRECNVRIATAARKLGWEWEVGAAGFVPLGGTWANCAKSRRTMRSEQEVFAIAGLEYLEPEARR